MTLQPRQFFHASRGNMQPGDKVLSANALGSGPHDYSLWPKEPDGTSRGDWVYSAEAEEEAWTWNRRNTRIKGRPTVYVVEPTPGQETRVETNHVPGQRAPHLMTRDEMTVIDRIDIPPPRDEGEVVQGTLPPIDWAVAGRVRPQDGGVRAGWEDDHGTNAVRYHLAATRRNNAHEAAVREAVPGQEREAYEAAWKRAGQQRLW